MPYSALGCALSFAQRHSEMSQMIRVDPELLEKSVPQTTDSGLTARWWLSKSDLVYNQMTESQEVTWSCLTFHSCQT